MTLYEKVIAIYPELADYDFANGRYYTTKR